MSSSKLVSSALLFLVGLYLVWRFSREKASSAAAEQEDDDEADEWACATGRATGKKQQRPSILFVGPLGFTGGAVDALGGGGWGPVATSGLLAHGSLSPSRVIGTVSLSEFFVTVAAVRRLPLPCLSP